MLPLLQDGVLSSRLVAESLQISEVETESGEGLSKIESSGDGSRPNSDIADVSVGDLCGFTFALLGLFFPF